MLKILNLILSVGHDIKKLDKKWKTIGKLRTNIFLKFSVLVKLIKLQMVDISLGER